MRSWSWRFLVGCCLFIACGGCVVGSSDGFAPEHELEPLESVSVVPRRLCELLDACGGEVVGEWKTDDVCVSFMTGGKPPVPSCDASTIEGIVDDVKGSYVFGEDGRYRANLELAGRVVVTMPRSCLGPGLGCADLGDSESECVARADLCECTQTLELPNAGAVSGTYETAGSTITYSNEDPMEYCVEEEHLTMRTLAELPRFGELSVEFQLELTRQ